MGLSIKVWLAGILQTPYLTTREVLLAGEPIFASSKEEPNFCSEPVAGGQPVVACKLDVGTVVFSSCNMSAPLGATHLQGN